MLLLKVTFEGDKQRKDNSFTSIRVHSQNNLTHPN